LVQSAPAPGEPAVVLDWAYESGPDRPIIAGDTGGPTCPPLIYRQPRNQDVLEGDRTSFSVVAQGTNVTYQWLRDGVPLINGASVSGADTRALTIDPVGRFDGGSISVLVGSDCGTVISDAATLSVTPICAPLTGGAVLLDGLDDHVLIPDAPD